MRRLLRALTTATLVLIAAGCSQPITIDRDVRDIPKLANVETVSPKDFFVARMRNRTTLSIKAYATTFEYIQETEGDVYAGYIRQDDKRQERNRYSGIVRCNRSKLAEEFPLYRTFTSSDKKRIVSEEHHRHAPFFQEVGWRLRASESEYDDTHMIFTTRYEYSGDFGSWTPFELVVRVKKTDPTDVTSQLVQ